MTICVLNPALIASVHADANGGIVVALREHGADTPEERAKGLAYLIEALQRLEEK